MENREKPPHLEAPLNPVPPLILALAVLIVGVEIGFTMAEAKLIGGPGAVGWRVQAIESYGFSGLAFDWMLERGQWHSEHLVRFVTYPFLHGGFAHALFAAVIVLAMGKVVAEALGQIRTLALFFLSSVIGALIWGLVLDEKWLMGAFPGAYGLIGGFTYLLILGLRARGAPPARAFLLIGMLAAVQLVFGAMTGFSSTDWLADFSGFAVGFGLSILLVPGGWSRLIEALRRR